MVPALAEEADDDPHLIARAFVEAADELPAAQALTARRGLTLDYDRAELCLTLRLSGPGVEADAPDEEYLIAANLADYRLLPPIWRFVHPVTRAEIGRAAYPNPQGSSVLHSNGLVCAHWSRLAYADHGGPHGDWGGPRSWQEASGGNSLALTIPDMLVRLIIEVRESRGRMEALPA